MDNNVPRLFFQCADCGRYMAVTKKHPTAPQPFVLSDVCTYITFEEATALSLRGVPTLHKVYCSDCYQITKRQMVPIEEDIPRDSS